MAQLTINNLSKIFHKSINALKQLSLVVEQGELLVLAGPSGCGKSTLLRCIAGLEKPDQGSICINDQTINTIPPAQRDVAMVFQNNTLYPDMTIRKNLLLAPSLHKQDTCATQKRMDEVCEVLDIADILSRKPRQISGGQHQRAALAKAVIRQPALLLLDEPFTSLDSTLKDRARSHLKDILKKTRTTTILVTHDHLDALMLANRLALMDQGQILQLGSPHHIYNLPASLQAFKALSSPDINLIQGTLHQQENTNCFQADQDPSFQVRLPCPLSQSVSDAEPLVLGVRPEHIAAENQPGSDPTQPAIQAQVTDHDYLGDRTIIRLTTAQGLYLSMTTLNTLTTPSQSLAPGQSLAITLNPDHLHIFKTSGSCCNILTVPPPSSPPDPTSNQM